MRVPGLQAKTGASSPDLVDFRGTSDLKILGFNGINTVEQVYLGIQFPHGWKEGSNIIPHVHWCPTHSSATGNVLWQMTYSWGNVNGVFPAATTIAAEADAAEVQWTQQIASFGELDGTGKTLSSMFMARIFRDPTDGDDTYAQDTGFLEFDIHYQSDGDGSDGEYTKSW